jgi:acyl dehydratase
MIARALVRSARGRGRGSRKAVLPPLVVEVADQAVDLHQWAQYARVCGMSVGTVLPGTFLHVMAFGAQVRVMGHPEFPFPMVGMVHTHNEMQTLGPVGLRDRISVRAWAESVRPHRHGATVELHAHAQTRSEVVWRGRSTYLVRGVDLDEDGHGPAAPSPGGSAEANHADVTHNEAPVAEALPTWAHWRLPADLGRRYAAASGDVNPIHLSPLAARALGFPRAIAHGMWTHARVLAALQGRVPPRHTVALRFRKPVLLPSTVAFRARATTEGHDFAVTDRAGQRQHLVGSIRSLA